jgi:hypothetical protein
VRLAPGIPHALFSERADMIGKTRAEAAARMRIHVFLTSPRLRGEVGGGAITKSPDEGDFSAKSVFVESPLHPLASARDLSPQTGRGEKRAPLFDN